MYSLEEIYQNTEQLQPLVAPQSLSATSVNLTAGTYAATNLAQVDGDLVSSNIKAGVIIFGVPGDSNVVDTSSGDVLPSDLLSGRTVYVGGVEVTGTVPAGTNLAGENGALVVTITAGLYSGSKTATVNDTNLISGNIKSGTTIFGVPGDGNVLDTSSGNAVAGDILTGKTAFVVGALVTGNVPAGDNVTGGDGVIVVTIPDALYSGSKTVTVTEADLVSGNIATGVVVFATTGTAFVATGDAVAGDVLTGKTFSKTGEAGVAGTLPDQAARGYFPEALGVTIAAGYHDGNGVVTGDVDLIAGNIKTNVTLFGVAGTLDVTGGSTNAAVPKTGETVSYAPHDDGDLEKGVAWPSPRFTVSANSNTIIDNLTGLMWARNANMASWNNSWSNAVTICNDLTYGGYDDWRLPNIRELHSLVDLGFSTPAMPSGHPFVDVRDSYWSSTSQNASLGYVLMMNSGTVGPMAKTMGTYVWPVRGGE